MDVPRALYVPTDDGFEATALTIGPWDPGLQHAGPPAALLAREVERAGGIEGGQSVRLAYDPRSGAGGPRARARLRRPAGAPDRARGGRPHRGRRPAADAPDRLADARPDRRRRPAARRAAAPGARRTGGERRGGGGLLHQDVAYHRALDWRFAAGSFNSPTRDGLDELPLRAGRGRADDGARAPAGHDRRRQRDLGGAGLDERNLRQRRSHGVAAPPPHGGWLGMDATTVLGDSGAAQAFAVLFDADGPIGRSAQSLFVEPR